MNTLWLSLAPLVALSAPLAAIAAPGELIGRVVDSATGQPVANATIVLQDKSGKVVVWAKTDAKGEYALTTDTLDALRLRPSRRKGLLEKLVRGTGQVVTAPVKLAAGVVKQIDPVKTARAAVATSITGNPAPLASQALTDAQKALRDKTNATTRDRAATAAKAVMGERAATPKEKRASLVPGEVFLSVAAPGFKELKEKTGAFWLESVSPATPDGKTPPAGVRAWLETIKLAATATPAEKKSEVENAAILLSAPTIDQPLVAAGLPVHITVKLGVPGSIPLKTRVFAREDKRRTVVELKPQEGAPGVYSGDLILDPKLEAGDSLITLVALRAEPIEVRLDNKKTDPLLEFAKNLDDLDPDKPYEFDLRIMASENRLELPITVLDPQKASTPKKQ
ncbi:MAG: carboxypeptidase regulatory-like domain-containing protein [Armatimonas sp.]